MNSLRVLLALALFASASQAAPFRWASVNDHSSADPHAQNQIVNNAINGQVYEALVKRGRNLEVIPGLAESWSQASPTVWRFNLRRAAKWHDGSSFTADDVVFSIKRAQGDTSTFRVYGRAVGEPRKVDANTVEFITPVPNPVMLETVSLLAIMSKPREGSPFKDLRVRRALYQAIDTDAINRVVMRGLAVPAGVVLPNPEAAGVPPEMNSRLPYDVAAAKRLLAEAGFPNGFATELDCQNVREFVCTAIAGMLARVNVTVKVNSLQNARFLAQGQAREGSFFLLGWGGPNVDAMFTLQPLLHGRNARGDGDFNWGDYRDEKMDDLIDQAKVEMDRAKRQALVNEAFRIERENIHHIPLHRRMAPWASRANVEVAYRPDSWLEVRWG